MKTVAIFGGEYEYLRGWKNLMKKLKTFFDSKLESDWEKKTDPPWAEWEKIIKHKGVI
jgi:hypothetical protein